MDPARRCWGHCDDDNVVVEAGIDEVTETGKEQGEDGDGDDLDNFLHEFSMESSTATKERDASSAMPAEVLHLGKSVKSPGEKLMRLVLVSKDRKHCRTDSAE